MQRHRNGKATIVRQLATLSKTSIMIYGSVSYKDVSYTVTAIADNVFRDTNLWKIVIADSVTYVGNMAFFNRNELYKISFKRSQSSDGELSNQVQPLDKK